MDDEECTHEITEWGKCVACSHLVEYDSEEEYEWERSLAIQAAGLGLGDCEGRGWYHDGSEDQAAYIEKRAKKPCPYC